MTFFSISVSMGRLVYWVLWVYWVEAQPKWLTQQTQRTQ
jgi:hypothetical protein